MTTPLTAPSITGPLLAPKGPWQRVDVLDSVGSTNQVAAVEPSAWRLIVADTQTSGRGRFDRQWASPPGTSLAISGVIPLTTPPAAWGWFPLLTGLAVVEALRDVTGSLAPHLKWPNDVLALGVRSPLTPPPGSDWGGGKLCGILCESVTTPHGPCGIAGIGLNISIEPADLPVPTATSLHLALGGPAPRREDVVVAVATHLAQVMQRWADDEGRPDAFLPRYRELCCTLGREVDLHTDHGIVSGRARDITAQGCLVIATEEGPREFSAGDVVHVRPQ